MLDLNGIMECTPLECVIGEKFTTNRLTLSFWIHATGALPAWMQVVREGLNKLQNSFSRHSGVGQNQVKTIVYSALASCVALPPASMQSWMLVFTSMTIKKLNQSSLRI